MSLDQVITKLLKQIPLPYGAISIVPWEESGEVVIHVMIDAPYMHKVSIPTEFHGYKVSALPRTAALAY